MIENSILDDPPPPRSKVSKRPNSSPLFQRHTKYSCGSRSVDSSSRGSASSSEVATGAQPYSPAPPCSVPLCYLPEHSEHLVVAVSLLDSISVDIDSSLSHLFSSHALVPVGLAVGDFSVSGPPAVPTIPCSQEVSSVSPGFWEQPPPTAPSPMSSAMLIDHSYSSDSLLSDFSPLCSPPPGESTHFLHTSS